MTPSERREAARLRSERWRVMMEKLNIELTPERAGAA